MRYRALDADGDMTFGGRKASFLVDTPDAVAQALRTRLLLMSGEWFLNTDEGTPYATEILGNNTSTTYDQAIRERILDTQGVVAISAYSSAVRDRKLSASATIDTEFGALALRLIGFSPIGGGGAILDFSDPDSSGLLPVI